MEPTSGSGLTEAPAALRASAWVLLRAQHWLCAVTEVFPCFASFCFFTSFTIQKLLREQWFDLPREQEASYVTLSLWTYMQAWSGREEALPRTVTRTWETG